MKYRKLTKQEIKILVGNGCQCRNWTDISVSKDFKPNALQNVILNGYVQLGAFTDQVELPGKVVVPSGLYNCTINNCVIGNDVLVSSVGSLSNYEIMNNVLIVDSGRMIVQDESTFGNGTELEILNEGGGRELKIHDQLTAQSAYIAVLYRDDSALIKKINEMVDAYTIDRRSSVGVIESHVKIFNCQSIIDVNIGSYAELESVIKLRNGTIRSCKEDPVKIGSGVIAEDFIILSGSKIQDSAVVEKCFIGQGVKIGKQYSAENSAFFANCEGFHGEACSIFAGPYTVTHHKSTLMIAGLFSFFNAGSGTNQSNHMYKLGPVHQGILERGCKTGSFSYMLWPCRAGAFTSIIGKHYTNFDTSSLPFSFIAEIEGKSIITPGLNLIRVGIKRDVGKWPNRDRRKDPEKMDLINFSLFNSYTVSKILEGVRILEKLYEVTDRKIDFIKYEGVQLKRILLKTSIKYYKMALSIYIGEMLILKIEENDKDSTFKQIKDSFRCEENLQNNNSWVDIAGLITDSTFLSDLLEDIKSGKIPNPNELNNAFKQVEADTVGREWVYFCCFLKDYLGATPIDLTKEQILELIENWRINQIKMNTLVINDAMIDFDQNSRIGFGIDGDKTVKDADFSAVRGEVQNNSFISGLKEEIVAVEKKVKDLKKLFS